MSAHPSNNFSVDRFQSGSLDALKPATFKSSADRLPKMESFSYEELQNINLEESNILKHLAKDIRISSTEHLQNQYGPPLPQNMSSITPQQLPSRVLAYHKAGVFAPQIAQKPRNFMQRSQNDLRSSTPSPKSDTSESGTYEGVSDEGTVMCRKQELEALMNRVSRLQKLEREAENIQQLYLSLLQSTNKREALEKAVRSQLEKENFSLRQENAQLRDHVDNLTRQVSQRSPVISEDDYKMAIKEREIAIARLTGQNKELGEGRKRQEIELDAQRATLDEQRNHISILDSALTDAQARVHALDEEIRKKSAPHVERIQELQQALKTLQSTSSKRELADKQAKLYLEEELAVLRAELRKGNQPNGFSESHTVTGKAGIHPKVTTPSLVPENLEMVQRRDSSEPLSVSQNNISQLESTVRRLEMQLSEKDAMVKCLQKGSELSLKLPVHTRSSSQTVKDSVSGSGRMDAAPARQPRPRSSAAVLEELWEV